MQKSNITPSKIKFSLEEKGVFDYVCKILFFSPFKMDYPLEKRDYNAYSDSFGATIVVYDHNGNHTEVSNFIQKLMKEGPKQLENNLKWCDKHKNTIHLLENGKCVFCEHNIQDR